MSKYKYIDRDILCKYDFSEEFLKTLDFEIEDIIPLRKVFILLTNKGKKILKLIDTPSNRINFINTSLEYLSLGYKDILSYYKNDKGDIVFESLDNRYVVLNMIEGREAAFSNPVEIDLCTKALANMHNASKGIFNILTSDIVQGNVGDYLPNYFNNAKEDLISIKDYIMRFRYKNEFDNIFLDNVDKFIEEIKRAIELLAMCNYNSLLEDFNKRVLCHNDLAHHNFIIDGVGVRIIDFDYCKIDTRSVDIANFALKVIKNSYYDVDTFKLIINSYNEVQKLNKDEIKLIYSILSYPRDFITISRDYYYKQKKWDYEVFLSRLNDKINNEEYRRRFIEEFIIDMNEYFY